MIEVKQSKLGDGEFNRGFCHSGYSQRPIDPSGPGCPLSQRRPRTCRKTILEDYVFEYGANHTAILLGYGSLINHSYEPNATYDINFENHTFDFYAYTDIKAGEEILINYNGEEDNMDPLWFLDDYEERMRELNEAEERNEENGENNETK